MKKKLKVTGIKYTFSKKKLRGTSSHFKLESILNLWLFGAQNSLELLLSLCILAFLHWGTEGGPGCRSL